MLTERWSVGRAGCVVSDTPQRSCEHAGDVEYYGGYCVAESIATPEKAQVLAAALDLLSALREFVESDAIVNYDSRLCWGCGQPKDQACETDCLLRRSRAAIAKADGKPHV